MFYSLNESAISVIKSAIHFFEILYIKRRGNEQSITLGSLSPAFAYSPRYAPGYSA
ncbi:hypothetical protein [Pedobacter sp. KACC 23697]|uniref:Uncharacterized protein n=1 Tax=Pedobacter sp. KACC 23697 TaxID=3149230 RepID=A0AAU7K4Z2_9SPHI